MSNYSTNNKTISDKIRKEDKRSNNNNLWTLLHEAYDRSKDSILTCNLETDQIEELMETLQ